MGVYRSHRKQGRLCESPFRIAQKGEPPARPYNLGLILKKGDPMGRPYNADLEQKKGDQKIAPTDSNLAEAAR